MKTKMMKGYVFNSFLLSLPDTRRVFNLYGLRPLASLSQHLGAYFGRVRHTHHGAHGAPYTIPRCLRRGGLFAVTETQEN